MYTPLTSTPKKDSSGKHALTPNSKRQNEPSSKKLNTSESPHLFLNILVTVVSCDYFIEVQYTKNIFNINIANYYIICFSLSKHHTVYIYV